LRLSGTVTAASVVDTGASGRKAFMHLQPGLPGFLLAATFGAAKLRVGGLRRDGYRRSARRRAVLPNSLRWATPRPGNAMIAS
jgi:hypothetical protein